jgi:polysaccharide biosynthesis transport protein
VLQIDADLRKSSVRFDFVTGVKSPGLGEILADSIATLQESPWLMVDGVHVIAAGAQSPFPSELLGTARLAELMKSWRQQFDRIIVDTPPVLSFTDAVLLARLADLALLVVHAGSTTAEAVVRAEETLRLAKPAAIAGVLNRMDFESPGYKHYYGHAYASRSVEERRA